MMEDPLRNETNMTKLQSTKRPGLKKTLYIVQSYASRLKIAACKSQRTSRNDRKLLVNIPCHMHPNAFLSTEEILTMNVPLPRLIRYRHASTYCGMDHNR